MRAKSEKRLHAEKLRQEQGLSYSDISKITGVNKSTLSAWLMHISLSHEQKAQLLTRMDENRASFAARAWEINRKRFANNRDRANQEGIDVFKKLPKDNSIDELSLAMLYLGEGSKSYGRVQIASTEAKILYYFLLTIRRLYHINENRLSFRVNLIKAARPFENDFILWWKNALSYPNARFLKTQYDSRSHKEEISKDYHGVCTLTYHDTYLQQRILTLAYTYIAGC
jgi:transcriptional regulator with XRE-family HTH domain